ncbi:hypothetical protein C2S52_013551 [Perilla frutescens var. hirtella]|nr:hypothetical protein C2S52_013551 [Perilla frutescens var. hirtella]
MVNVRDIRHLNRPPPMYKPPNMFLSVVLHYSGEFVLSPIAKYMGGSKMIIDKVVARQLTLTSLKNSLAEWLLIDGVVKIYVLEDNMFKVLSSDDEVREACVSALGVRQVVFYVEEGGEGEEDDESEDDSDYNMVKEPESEDDMLFDKFVDVDDESEDDSEVDADVMETEFDEYKNSDGEYERPPPVFNSAAIFHPDFSLGMIFSSKDQFKKAVQSHAINNKRSVKFTKNALDRCYARCVDEDCPWRINLTKVNDEDTFHIREFVGTHECDTTFQVKNMKSSWLCDRFTGKDNYVHDFLTVETFKKSYAATIRGVNGAVMWGESIYILPLPPQMIKGKGKQANARIKASDEKVEKLAKNKTKLRRRPSIIRCSGCGGEGHNSVTCGRNKVMQITSTISGKASYSSSGSRAPTILPPSTEFSDEHEGPEEPSQTLTQASQSKPPHVPGSSMLQQLHQGKFKGQSPLILENQRKFISLAEIQAMK